MKLKLSAYIIIFFILSGCDIQNLKESEPDLENIMQVEQQANTAYQNEDWKAAEVAYLDLTQKAPSQAEPWFRLGNIYARTERLDAAVTAYRNALLRNNEYSKAWHNLGIVHLRQATTTFKDMLQHTSKDDPLYQRAVYVVNAVSDLMASGFETTNEN
jgi:cytochrome c-type biogenesis protein CcmH/NrfG